MGAFTDQLAATSLISDVEQMEYYTNFINENKDDILRMFYVHMGKDFVNEKIVFDFNSMAVADHSGDMYAMRSYQHLFVNVYPQGTTPDRVPVRLGVEIDTDEPPFMVTSSWIEDSFLGLDLDDRDQFVMVATRWDMAS